MIKKILKQIRRIIFPHFIILDRWFKVNGNKTLRLNYPLNEDSIVFDVGGYKGEWTEDIYKKFHCNVYNFEVVKHYVDDMKKKFSGNNKIFLYNFGLSNVSKEINLSLDGEGTSMFKKYNMGKCLKGQIKDIKEFVDENNIKKIDLIKMNIEGAEYDLLNRIINSGLINKIDNLQIQFHKIYKGYLYWQPFYVFKSVKKRRRDIQKKLEKTHRLTYNYPFVWENWEKKSGNKK